MDYKFKTPSFFSILTADVRYCKELTASEKIFYSEISALANIKGYCTANNDYFCELYKVNKRTIQRWLENLKTLKFIDIIEDSDLKIRKIYIILDSKKTKLKNKKVIENDVVLTEDQYHLLTKFIQNMKV